MKRRVLALAFTAALVAALAAPGVAHAQVRADSTNGVTVTSSVAIATYNTPFNVRVDSRATTQSVSPTDTVYLLGLTAGATGPYATLLGTATADAGFVDFSVRLYKTAELAAIYGGELSIVDGSITTATGLFSDNSVNMPLRAKLGAPRLATSTVRYKGPSVRVRGTIAPKHATGSRSVTLYYEKKTSTGAYKVLFTYKPMVKYQATGYSTYEMYVWSSARSDIGQWRVRARHADAAHVAGYSPYTYFVIR